MPSLRPASLARATAIFAPFALIALWLVDTQLDVLGPTPVRLLVAVLALLVAAVLLGGVVWSARSLQGRILLGLTAIAVLVRFVALDFELSSHYHNDEGVFFAEAERINNGRLLPPRFHYPHLLYYLSAVGLWLTEVLPALFGNLAHWLYGIEGKAEIGRITLRSITALCGALTTIPVFLAARRLGGLLAACAAGLLITFSPVYNEVAHLAISDVPSGFFAAIAFYFIVKLTEREDTADYIWAGVSAGLAASSKYPAGVVAVGIVGVWLAWRVRTRTFDFRLVFAGLASLAAFLATFPSLWLLPERAFAGEGFDIGFGFRQYAQQGWLGAIKESNAKWYGGQVLTSFGSVAIVAGLMGWFFARGRQRFPLLVSLIYPAAYLALILSMNMVVKRNLQPVLPALAVALGFGAATLGARIQTLVPALNARGGRPLAKSAFLIVFLTAMVAAPAARTIRWDVSRLRPSTSELALSWIDSQAPQGATIVREAYTPKLDKSRFSVLNSRYAARFELETLLGGEVDYLLLAANAHARFLNRDNFSEPHHAEYAARYRQMMDSEAAARFEPGPWRAGPSLALYRADPDPIVFRSERRFRPQDATYFSHPKMAPDRPRLPIAYQRTGQSVVFKDYFEKGHYTVTLLGPQGPISGGLYVVSRENVGIGEFTGEGRHEIEIPERGKYLFRVFLPNGALSGLVVRSSKSPESQREIPSSGS